MKRVLFICTGNYYRSRFAEYLFDTLARDAGVAWRADSRGTDVFGAGSANVGPLSLYVREALASLDIPVDDQPRQPLPLTADDLLGADLIIAVSRAEHRPHLQRAFPDQIERVKYWGVEDERLTAPSEALRMLEQRVRALVDCLAAGGLVYNRAADRLRDGR